MLIENLSFSIEANFYLDRYILDRTSISSSATKWSHACFRAFCRCSGCMNAWYQSSSFNPVALMCSCTNSWALLYRKDSPSGPLLPCTIYSIRCIYTVYDGFFNVVWQISWSFCTQFSNIGFSSFDSVENDGFFEPHTVQQQRGTSS